MNCRNTIALSGFTNIIEENYAIVLDSSYMFTKKKLNIMELNMILIVLNGVCMHKPFLNFTAVSMNTLQFR